MHQRPESNPVGSIPAVKKLSAAKQAPVSVLSRRAFVVGLPLLAAGCAGANYGYVRDGGFGVPPVDVTAIDSSLMRQEVAWKGKEKPGTIVVNVEQRRLYLVQDGGKALRYGIGVARTSATNFRGSAVIGRKEKWPRWTPTANMMAAIPLYRSYAGGMDGGPDNPSRRPSARRSRAAASACSTKTSSIYTTA